MNDLLSVPILVSLLNGVGLLPLLALLGHGPWRIEAPLRRFLLAAFIATMAWAMVLFTLLRPGLPDLIASGLIMLTALVVGFSFWNLLVWGCTISLLASLANSDKPLSFDECVAAYTRGGTVRTFARDRLTILLGLGLVRADAERIRVKSPLAVPLARTATWLRQFFGVNS